MNILSGFDARTVPMPESSDYELLPAGIYQVRATECDEKTTKAGTGSYLQYQFTIDGPTHAGRKIWGRFHLRNPNEKAVEIAKAQLATFCLAVGVPAPRMPEELLDRPLAVRVRIKPAQGEYREANEIVAYIPTADHAPPRTRGQAAAGKAIAAPDDDLPF